MDKSENHAIMSKFSRDSAAAQSINGLNVASMLECKEQEISENILFSKISTQRSNGLVLSGGLRSGHAKMLGKG